MVRPPEIGGYGLAAQWSDDFHHALHTVLTGERAGYYGDFGAPADLAQTLTNAFVYDGRYSRFRDRRHGRPATGLSGHRFFGYLQNHDQIGNRAKGERSSHLLSPGRLKIAAALVLTSPFVPLLFQGEEWGPPRRSSTLRITRIPSWVGPSAKGAGRSSPPSAGLSKRCQIPKTRPHTCVRGSIGMNWRVSPMPVSWTGRRLLACPHLTPGRPQLGLSPPHPRKAACEASISALIALNTRLWPDDAGVRSVEAHTSWPPRPRLTPTRPAHPGTLPHRDAPA